MQTVNKRNDESSLNSALIYGKVPPQARELEEAVLGALLLEADFDEVSSVIHSDCFYVPSYNLIFRAMQSLSKKNQPIDMLTVTEELLVNGDLDKVGGPFAVTKLTNNVVSSAHVQSHAAIIFEKWILREQIRICAEGLNAAYGDNDAFDSLDSLQNNLNTLASSAVITPASHISNLLTERFRRLEDLRHRTDHLTGVPTGFKNIDLLTAGWQDTDLIILAARPSVGKTAFALNLARNAAHHRSKPTPVAFFSMEMSKGQLTDRLLSSESGIGLDLITRARMDDSLMQHLYQNGLQPLSNYNLFFDDTPALNILDLKTRCRKLKRDKNIGLVIIDYLQLMSGIDGRIKSGNREQEISNISRGLKAMAKELKLPVIALSQLSRDIEKQKRDPMLSDLRESGAIEADADAVVFLTRPDYQQTDLEDESVKSYADVHFKKHRNGDLAKIPMRTMLNIQRWMTNEEYDLYQFNSSSRNIQPISDDEAF